MELQSDSLLRGPHKP